MGELQTNKLSGVSYPVILRPSDVKFSVKNIPTKFDNGNRLTDVLEDIKKGKVLPKEIPPMEVIWYCDLWEWYTLNNRRLWLFQELEKMEICKYASMTRVEVMSSNYQYPSQLFPTVNFVIPSWETDEKRFLTKSLSLHSYEDDYSMETEFIKDEAMTSYTLVNHNPAVDGYCSIDITEPSSPNANEDDFSSDSRNTGSSQKRHSIGSLTKNVSNVYIGGGVTVHTKSVPETLDVKMECDISPVFSPKRRSRSRVRSKSRTSSFSEQSDMHCGSSKVQSRDRSKGRTSSFSEEAFKISQTRGRSKGRSCNSFSEQEESTLQSCDRSNSKKYIKESRSKSTERQNSFSSLRNRSRSQSMSRFSRSKSVSSISDRTSSKALVKYNSFMSGKDIFIGTSRSSFTSNSKLSRCGSLYSANSRYRNKSNLSVEDEHGEKTSISSRKRSLSSCSHASFRSKEDASICSSHRSVRSTASSQSYQLHKFRPEIADRYQRPRRQKYVQNDFADYSESTKSKSLVKTEDSIFPLQLEKCSLLKSSGIQLSYLYALWAKRRHEFLHARKTGQLHLMYGPEEGYLCGLCFKKFKSVVDLQQHSEELLHYACVTCGRFFNTYTALGQHCKALLHTKD